MLNQFDIFYIEEKRKALIAEVRSARRNTEFSALPSTPTVRLTGRSKATVPRVRRGSRRYRDEIGEELQAIRKHLVRLSRILGTAIRSTQS